MAPLIKAGLAETVAKHFYRADLRQLGFKLRPQPQADIFQRRAFQPVNIIQQIMVQRCAQSGDMGVNGFKIDDLTMRVGLAFHCDAGAETVAMHARIGMPLRVMPKMMGGIKGKITRQLHAAVYAAFKGAGQFSLRAWNILFDNLGGSASMSAIGKGWPECRANKKENLWKSEEQTYEQAYQQTYGRAYTQPCEIFAGLCKGAAHGTTAIFEEPCRYDARGKK